MSSKSLKSDYMKWLVMFAIADLILVLLFVVPGFSMGASIAELGNWRLLTTIVANDTGMATATAAQILIPTELGA